MVLAIATAESQTEFKTSVGSRPLSLLVAAPLLRVCAGYYYGPPRFYYGYGPRLLSLRVSPLGLVTHITATVRRVPDLGQLPVEAVISMSVAFAISASACSEQRTTRGVVGGCGLVASQSSHRADISSLPRSIH